MTEIVTVTPNPALDLSFTVERLVDTCKLRCTEPRKDAGGGGVNVARVLQRLGADCRAVFLAGGNTGTLLQRLIEAERVPSEQIIIGGETRENVTVREASSGREFRFVLPGPAVTEFEWHRCLGYLEALNPLPGYIVASGSLPPGVPAEFYAYIAQHAKSKGVRMVLDASGDALAAALKVGVFLVKPSLDELRELTGKPLHEESEWREAAYGLVERGLARNVALTLGSRGALMVTEDRTIRVPALQVPVVSAVGAGDSFLAALVWALEHRPNAEQALQYAVAAGCAAVMKSGTALCDPADVVRLYRILSGSTKIAEPQ